MYKLLTIKDGDTKKIKQIKEQLDNPNLKDNPKLLILPININNKNINIIDDSNLLTGTKMRVAYKFIKTIIKENKEIDTLVYSGNYNGFGALSVAYSAYKLNLKSEIFLGSADIEKKKICDSRQVSTLLACNAKVYLCDTYRNARNLLWKNVTDGKWDIKKNIFVVPMGLNDDKDIMINILAKQIKKASINTTVINKTNLRIWLVSGSGGIAQSISIAFPNAKLFILPYGGNKYKKKLKDWSRSNKNITILNEISNLDYSLIDNYYRSVNNYDALIFPYVLKFGLNNDYIWNVASD
jgi:hypothetical protein